MSDGRVEFEITADGKKAYASIDQITQQLQKSGVKWEKTAKESTDSIGGSFEGMLKKITAAFSAAAIGKALVDFGKQAIEAASDLAEVQNVVDTTFGDNGAAKIEAWAKKAGTQFGLTEIQAKRFTSTLGAMMKSSGLAGEQIVSMSTDMAGLAADMASFYNLDFDTAFQKIRSGISGETEPLKQLGINMSVANLEAFALQKGLGKTFSEMTQGEQIMLRYQYMMQATADAQGDFSKTADGYANATRRVETAIETIKAKTGEMLMNVVKPLTTGLADVLEKLTTDPNRTVLDEFKEIDANTERKLAEITQSANDARDLLSILQDIGEESNKAKENINGTKIEISDKTTENAKSLASSLHKINENGGAIQSNLAELQETSKLTLVGTPLYSSVEGLQENSLKSSENVKNFKTTVEELNSQSVPKVVQDVTKSVEDTAKASESAATHSNEWLEVCKRLVQTIPGLTSIIDTQTGEIKGGTAAVDEYIDTWERAQKNLALIDANRQKHSALTAKESELDTLLIDKVVRERRERLAREQLNKMLQEYGINKDADSIGVFNANSAYATEVLGISGEKAEKLAKEVAYYKQLKYEMDSAVNAYDKQKKAYDEAVISLEENDKALLENMTTEEKAALIVEKYAEAQQAAKDAVEAASAAVQDYRKNAIEKTTESVNKLISGFKEIKMPSYDELPKYYDLTGALQSQLEFMQKYRENLEAAKNAGLDANLLAELSDGSEESAKYLQTIAENPSHINEINEAYRAVNAEKKTFAETLADNNLAVDEAYKELLKTENDAKLTQQQIENDIVSNCADSLDRMRAAIERKTGDISTAVSALNAVLAKIGLPAWSFAGLDGSFETGLSYVPFNGFLAELHEGEGILTAEENRIWQNFKTGQRGVDYDQLGGVMRDNIKPGGNVYLDGRVVGSVISDMQGKSYRQLQRSGWQG